eukprot:m.363779 g.363779  ORF g.363779 m.363779 type:complete len:248 (+) comp24184_c0_seq1:207-950(+)
MLQHLFLPGDARAGITERDVWVDLAVSFLALVPSFILFKLIYVMGSEKTTRRGLAWFLTSICAVTLAGVSIPFIHRLWVYGVHYEDLFSIHRVAVLGAHFFAVYLVLDLVFGYFFYREQIDFVSGYVHHTLYFVLIVVLLKQNSIVVLMTAMVEEIPTIVLSLGHLYPPWRSDLLFGCLFFLTRICFHAWYLAQLTLAWLYYDHPSTTIALVSCVAVFILHSWWFSKWLRRDSTLRAFQAFLDELFI